MDFKDSKNNEYKDFAPFAHGGMGKIYKGNSPITGKPVILKLVEFVQNGGDKKQKRELVVSQTISHKNVVKVYDTGIKSIDNIEYLYLLEKFYQNGNLREKIKKGMSLDICYQMMYDLLLGMQEIHKTAIHRDLKPDNILLDDDNSLVISDFGLSRFVTDATQTETFKGWGTIKYMSPECWTYEKNTPAMDIYSLGLIFFEILTGESPFHPETQTRDGWRDCHLFSNIPNITKYRQDVNVKLNQIIQKMTAKRISERYKSIDEIFQPFLDSRKQSSETNSEIELLAQKANSVFETQTAEKLKKERAFEEQTNYIAFLNQHIDDLFNRVVSVVEQINEKLETVKYGISRTRQQQRSVKQSLTISLVEKSFTISFLEYDSIDEYDKDKKQKFIDRQRQQYGIYMKPYDGCYFTKNNIVLIGLAETTFKIKKFEFGFNLLLKKPANVNYGEWYVCQFSENITPANTPFGVSLINLFSEFEKLEYSMYHTKTERKLEDKDIIDLIRSISN